MENIILNYSGAKVRREMLHGRPHLVAQMTTIVPGVLNGSKGRLFYSQEETAKDPATWNHTPIVVYHPNVNGRNVSARSPEILNSSAIGVLLRSQYRGKLTHEGWFDIENTKRVDSRVYDALVNGRPMELSTGLFTDNEPAPPGANYKGQPYDYIARNYRPDHLAILPDQVGACSIKDGCGLHVNKKNESVSNGGPGSGPQPGDGPHRPYKSGTVDDSVKGLSEHAVTIATSQLKYQNSLPDSVTDSVREYVQTKGNELNTQIRSGNISGSHKETIKHLDTAIEKSPAIPMATVVHRVIPDGDVYKHLRAGDSFTEKAYTSTSFDKEYLTRDLAMGKPDPKSGVSKMPMVIDIKIPKGGKGLYVGDDGESSEIKELLLPRNTKFKVTGTKVTSKGIRRVQMEVVHETTTNSDGSWATLPNGAHILVKDGAIVGGPKALRSKKDKDAKKRGFKNADDEARFKETSRRQDIKEKTPDLPKRSGAKPPPLPTKKSNPPPLPFKALRKALPVAKQLPPDLPKAVRPGFLGKLKSFFGVNQMHDDCVCGGTCKKCTVANGGPGSGPQKGGGGSAGRITKALNTQSHLLTMGAISALTKAEKAHKTGNKEMATKYINSAKRELKRGIKAWKNHPDKVAAMQRLHDDLTNNGGPGSGPQPGGAKANSPNPTGKKFASRDAISIQVPRVKAGHTISHAGSYYKVTGPAIQDGKPGYLIPVEGGHVRTGRLVSIDPTSNALPNQPKSQVSGKFKRINAGTGKGPVHEAAQYGHVMLSTLDNLRGKTAEEETAKGVTIPSWASDEGKFNKAKLAADTGNCPSDKYWATVAHIYERLGGVTNMINNGGPGSGPQKGGGSSESKKGSSTKERVAKAGDKIKISHSGGISRMDRHAGKEGTVIEHNPKLGSIKVKLEDGVVTRFKDQNVLHNQQGITMDRDEVIEYITTNCSCWNGEDDVEVLNYFSDDKLTAIAEDVRLNSEREATLNAIQENLGEAVFNAACTTTMEENALPFPPKKKAPVAPAPAAVAEEETPEEEAPESEEEEAAEEEVPAPMTKNQLLELIGNLSVEEWQRIAPREVVEATNNAMKIEKEEKARLATKLVANLKGEAQKTKFNGLMKKSLGDLVEISDLMTSNAAPAPQSQGLPSHTVRRAPMFAGAAGAPTSNSKKPTNNAEDDNDFLPLPTINFAEEAKLNGKHRS